MPPHYQQIADLEHIAIIAAGEARAAQVATMPRTQLIRGVDMNQQQKAMLPDLVALALIGFSFLKADKSASEWSHPALAAFRADVEPELMARREKAQNIAAMKWGS